MIARPFGRTGVSAAVIGQGTWRMGQARGAEAEEVAALRLGIDLGLTHIDTAEMSDPGTAAERVVGQAVAGRRGAVLIATKVLPLERLDGPRFPQIGPASSPAMFVQAATRARRSAMTPSGPLSSARI